MRLKSLTLLFFLLLTSSIAFAENPTICTYYYVWYGGSDHPWVNITAVPILGYYNSTHVNVLVKQLRLIREANIDCVIISWWGPGHYTDKVAKKVFELIAYYGLKAVILVEPYLGSDPSNYNQSWWNQTIAYIKQYYIEKYSEAYFYLDGKPLIMAFNPIGMKYNPSKDFQEYTIRIVGNDIDNARYQDWDLWPDYDRNLAGNLKVRKDGYVAIAPRFYDEHFRQGGVPPYDPNLTQAWYQKQWNWILRNKDRINIIAIYSWNEYHENSAIEPQNNKLDTKKPYYLYNITSEYIDNLKKEHMLIENLANGFKLGNIVAFATLIIISLIGILSIIARR